MARILHLLSQRPGRSGSGVFLQAMVREAARCGHRQHVVAAGPPGTTAGELPPAGPDDFTLIPFPSDDAPFPVPGNSDVMPYPSTVFSRMTERQVEQYLDVSARVMRQVRDRFRPDVVHAHHLWMMTALAREVFADVPVVATSHNAELRQMVKAPHLAPRVVPGIRALDRVCVLTPRSRDDTVAAYGVDPERIALTGAGYRGDLFHPPAESAFAVRARLRREDGIDLSDAPVATFVGRLSTPKGVPFLLEAAALARRRIPDLQVVLVGATGTGDDGPRVEALARAAGPWVTHVGARSPETVARLLQASDLFALPSLFEGLPLTMLEAAACGCPCLVSGLPTIASWVPDEWVARGHFSLVPPLATTDADVPVPADVPRYVGAIADALVATVARPHDRADLAARLAPHTWSAVFARYERVYAEVLDPVVESR